jgi:1-phosphofructokinase
MPDTSGAITVFAPSPLVTVTIEDRGGEPDIHVHAGGQGVWQARMISSLGVPVVLCAALGGETGEVLRHLIAVEGVEADVEPVNASNGGYVHDRREGQRQDIVETPGGALDRHELDALYERTLTRSLDSTIALLSGASDDRIVPASIYRRLTADLSANGCQVIGDLSGSQLKATLAGGPFLVKVSHKELLRDGWASSEQPTDLVGAMHRLREDGAGAVVVSRAAQPTLALVDDEVFEVRVPPLEAVDPRGAGDSMTAGLAASLARGESMLTALRVGAACGALNVVRRGLGTGGSAAVATLAKRVELRRWDP